MIGALQEGLLHSSFSLAEARVLYELAQRAGVTATELGRELDLDPGYLSRILQRFERDGLLARDAIADRPAPEPAVADPGRARRLRAARCALARGDRRVAGASAEPAQAAVVAAMGRIEALLGALAVGALAAAPASARRYRLGGGDGMARSTPRSTASMRGSRRWWRGSPASSSAQHDPARERCWIAEHDGVNVGSVFLVRQSDEEAKLRLLLVEPAARGLGIGRRLVAECIGFARETGYRRVTLWTNEVLVAARAIYQQAGFRLVASKPHSDFGPPMVGEDWDLALR